MVVLSGLEASVTGQRIQEIKRVVPGATILIEPEGGLSRARNAALFAVAPTAVVAYIDDDAVIADTWCRGMKRVWSEASHDAAAVGGPIDPLFLQPRPAWLSDYLLTGLSILNHGPEQHELVTPNAYLYGANLSVLAEHALAVGGFDISQGPLGRGPGFGDDTDIQERLRAAGLRVLYDPEIAVAHRIPPERLRRRAMLERRYAQGRAQARATPVPQFLPAARSVITSLGKSVAYSCAGKHDLAMDKLTYGAQSVGVMSELLDQRRGTLGAAS